MKKSHVENTVGPWAKQKLDGLEAYLHAYTMALKKQSFDLIYIDAFAGAGRSKIRTAWTDADEEDIQLIDDEFMRSEEEFIEGSPRRALGLENPFSQYYFFDADAGRAALLNGLQSDFPERKIDVQVGDANGLIQRLAPRLSGRNTKGVAFLDPYGPHLDWQTVAALGATKNFEVIINFPLGMAINRLITRSGEIPDNWRNGLNGCFGSTDWENLVYADQTDLFGDTTRHKVDDAAQRLLNYYVGRLKHLFGHPRPGCGAPLCHEGRRPRGVRAVTNVGSSGNGGRQCIALRCTRATADPARVVTIARSWLGTPFHDQASLRGVGCDCLGLARGVWREVVGPEPFPIPPYSRDWGETGPREVLAEGATRMMIEVELAKAGPGALVLFRMKPRAIAKHVGILTGPDSFLHAYERLGVIEEPLTPSWRQRIAFAFLFPQR